MLKPDGTAVALLLAMKERRVRPTVLVSLQNVSDVRGMSYNDAGALTIGAATTYSHLETVRLQGGHQILTSVASDIADACVRQMGTIGGALCQADPAFDFPVAALLSSAELELSSTGGTRRIAVSDFLRGPYLTALNGDEMLTRIQFPAPDPSARFAFVKHRLRRFDSAIVSVGCVLSLDDGKVASARIACGAVGPKPLELTAAERVIAGQEPSQDLLHEAGVRAADESELAAPSPVIRQSYKRDVLPVIVTRALRAAMNWWE